MTCLFRCFYSAAGDTVEREQCDRVDGGPEPVSLHGSLQEARNHGARAQSAGRREAKGRVYSVTLKPDK